MTPQAQREEIAANFDLLGKLSVAIVPLSFVIGLASLAGQCLAIGGPAWNLVGFSDAVAAATKAAPLAFILLSIVTIGVVLFATRSSATTDISDQSMKLLNVIRYMRTGLFVVFVVGTVAAAISFGWQATLVLGPLTALMAATAQVVVWYSPASRVPKYAVALSLALIFTTAVTSISFAFNTGYLQRLPEHRQTHTICWDASDQKKCEYGLIVARFSESTLFRGDDTTYSYIANSEIKRIRGIDKDPTPTPGH